MGNFGWTNRMENTCWEVFSHVYNIDYSDCCIIMNELKEFLKFKKKRDRTQENIDFIRSIMMEVSKNLRGKNLYIRRKLMLVQVVLLLAPKLI